MKLPAVSYPDIGEGELHRSPLVFPESRLSCRPALSNRPVNGSLGLNWGNQYHAQETTIVVMVSNFWFRKTVLVAGATGFL